MSTAIARPLESEEPRRVLFASVLASQSRSPAMAGPLVSTSLHIIGILVLVVPVLFPHIPVLPLPLRVIKIFAPAQPRKQERKKEKAIGQGSLLQYKPQPLPSKDASPPDPGHMQITFAKDPGAHQLLAILERFNAALGFASPAQVATCQRTAIPGRDSKPRCFYEYHIAAPNWDRVEGSNFSLGGYFLVKVRKPDPPYVQEIRSRYEIPADYVAWALLPEEMRSDVDDSVEEDLKRSLQLDRVVATSVEITFAAAEPRGFRLTITSTRPAVPPPK